MQFILKIDSQGNTAMQTDGELAFALESIAYKIRMGEEQGPVMDGNGNRIGSWAAKYVPNLRHGG